MNLIIVKKEFLNKYYIADPEYNTTNEMYGKFIYSEKWKNLECIGILYLISENKYTTSLWSDYEILPLIILTYSG